MAKLSSMYGDLRPEREDAYVEEHGQNKRQKTGDDDDDGGVATKNDVATKKDGTHLSFPLFNQTSRARRLPPTAALRASSSSAARFRPTRVCSSSAMRTRRLS